MAAGRAAVGAMAMAIVLGAVLLLTNFHDGESKGNTGRVVLKQNAAVRRWMNTLKGAESFLSDAENGKLPAKAIVPGEFDSVEKLLKKTKEQVHREATRLHALDAPEKPPTPIGAKKLELLAAPGEENAEEGFQGTARRDARPGQVVREVTDMVDQYKAEEDEAAKELLRTIASKIVEAFDNHGLSPAQIARELTDTESGPDEQGESSGPMVARQIMPQKGQMLTSGVTSDTILGKETPDVGVADCTDLPGLPKSSKFCLEGRPWSKLPGMNSAMTSGDMRAKIKELKEQARKNMGLPNANKVDQEELSKLQDIVKSTKKALNEQEGKLKEIREEKHKALQDLDEQKKVISMAKDARKQRLAWRAMDDGMTRAYKEAGFKLPLSAGFAKN